MNAKILASLLLVPWTTVSGCDRRSDGLPRSERKLVDAARADNARERVVDGIECSRLLTAIATAKTGPLRRQVEDLGLSAVDFALAGRWRTRVKRDAKRGRLSAEEFGRLLTSQPAVILDEDELEASAGHARACIADINASRRE